MNFFLEDFGHINSLRFPYTLSLLKCVNHYYLHAKLAGKPTYSDFYNSNHKSGALQITNKILIDFNNDASAENRIPIILIIPTYDDLKYFKKNQKWVYQNLIDLLRKEGIEPLHVGEDFLEKIGTRNINVFFTITTGHLNVEGNKILAGIVYKYIKEKVSANPSKPTSLPASP